MTLLGGLFRRDAKRKEALQEMHVISERYVETVTAARAAFKIDVLEPFLQDTLAIFGEKASQAANANELAADFGDVLDCLLNSKDNLVASAQKYININFDIGRALEIEEHVRAFYQKDIDAATANAASEAMGLVTPLINLFAERGDRSAKGVGDHNSELMVALLSPCIPLDDGEA